MKVAVIGAGIGGAVHAMSPARRSGANTALQNAALLASKLGDTDCGDQDVVAAIAAYEREMIVYGFDAVRASREAGPAGGSRRRSSLFRRLAGIR
ncbi:FAD-dependent monooxygenase [Catenulispora rubra]|uniref:FAD-dependent monooxygenase n=1 Tax=Catenulispora rubra TaxID=280293 RepID=UPI001892217F|nr:FAD-dependent monooxygenase [Catenulispora rubra]